MLSSILIGGLAGFAVLLPAVIRTVLPGVRWYAPVGFLVVAAIAVLLQKFIFDRRSESKHYDGLPDLLIHIHSPGQPDSTLRWGLRGLISQVLVLCGAPVGPEGPATEWAQAMGMRSRRGSSRWFEQRRRSDAASAIAAGVAGAFQAPFAAILFPMELGTGGRTLSAVLSALTAFACVRGIGPMVGLTPVARPNVDFYWMNMAAWAELALTLLVGALMGWMIAWLIGYVKARWQDLFSDRIWLRIAGVGLILFIWAVVYPGGHARPSELWGHLLGGSTSSLELAIQSLSLIFGIAMVGAGFGTVGVIWPLFLLGALVETLFHQSFFVSLGMQGSFSGVVGATAFLTALLGTPLAATVLCFEMSQSLDALVPCLIAGFAVQELAKFLGARTLLKLGSDARGLNLIEGRSAEVLKAIFVREAMVSDHQTVLDHESVSELHGHLSDSRYPFLPVVNSQGVYVGMITADMIQDAWRAQDPKAAHSPLTKLLEAKDLIYRYRLRIPVLRVEDRLSDVSSAFMESPCVPVVSEDKKVLGLLFNYSVRLAYDREVARRSLTLQNELT